MLSDSVLLSREKFDENIRRILFYVIVLCISLRNMNTANNMITAYTKQRILPKLSINYHLTVILL